MREEDASDLKGLVHETGLKYFENMGCSISFYRKPFWFLNF
jgi:hypothetical protein